VQSNGIAAKEREREKVSTTQLTVLVGSSNETAYHVARNDVTISLQVRHNLRLNFIAINSVIKIRL
jgi:hypothetical protein